MCCGSTVADIRTKHQAEDWEPSWTRRSRQCNFTLYLKFVLLLDLIDKSLPGIKVALVQIMYSTFIHSTVYRGSVLCISMGTNDWVHMYTLELGTQVSVRRIKYLSRNFTHQALTALPVLTATKHMYGWIYKIIYSTMVWR